MPANQFYTMKSFNLTPAKLAVWLILYFVVLFGTTSMALSVWPEVIQSLPLGGHDALDAYSVPSGSLRSSGTAGEDESDFEIISTLQARTGSVKSAVLFLSLHLAGTILVMVPITWTYTSIKWDVGYRKNFARTLIVLPICATTIVLLIQDSLALAFGLAAMVAAVRFRVTLDEAIDGIFVFAAICVGLAAGIGYLGIAGGMAVFFCFANLILWQLDYGENPLDQIRQEKKRAKITQTSDMTSS